MVIIVRTLMLAVLLACAIPGTSSAMDEATESYIKVEIRGMLITGVAQIGGETTGVLIKASNVVWELDLQRNDKLWELANSLNGKDVLVSGTFRRTKGLEVPIREIVSVESLRAASR